MIEGVLLQHITEGCGVAQMRGFGQVDKTAVPNASKLFRRGQRPEARHDSGVRRVFKSQSWHSCHVGGVVRGEYSIGRMLRGLRGRSGVKAAEDDPETGTAKAAHEGEASPAEPRHAGCAACSAAKGDDGLFTQGLVLVVLLFVSFATRIRLLPRARSAFLSLEFLPSPSRRSRSSTNPLPLWRRVRCA